MKTDTEVPLTLTNPGPKSMTIARAVREANSSREVYLLLAAYLETLRLGGEVIEPFREIATAPLVSIDDVKERTMQLFFMLQAVSKRLDDNSRVAVKEALYVFGAVLDRISSLEANTDRAAQRFSRLQNRTHLVRGRSVEPFGCSTVKYCVRKSF